MTKFKLYEDILSRSWNRYFYDVEANTIEEAVEKVRYGEVDCYDSEQIYEVIDELDPVDNNGKLDDDELTSSYKRSLKTGAMFDARCFNIPKEEVTNCILWRQQDATRNSISSAGQAHFSHKQLEGLNSNQIQELLFQEKGINWNDYPTKFKRGSCCIKKYHQTMNQTLRSYWFIDNEIPIFKGEDREYIEKLIA